MDKLYEVAKFYAETLKDRCFHLKAGKRGVTVEFNIVFGAEHFKHIFGLHKLSDLPMIQKNSSSTIFRQILTHELTYEMIGKSKYFSKTEPRLRNFKELESTLFSKELMIKSLKGKFNLITADYMLTQRHGTVHYAHLFLAEKIKGVVLPVTFLINRDNQYIKNNPNKWTVLSIEEVTKK